MNLIDVPQAASLLGVSETWIRRHIAELPTVRVGRLIRFDAEALSQQIAKNSLKPERTLMVSRYQRGSIVKRGKVFYGVFREDTGSGRAQRWMRLGTAAELPTKNHARNKLASLLSASEAKPVVTDISFKELVDRWSAAEGPTMKDTSFKHYLHSLRVVLPVFGDQPITKINREAIQAFLAARAQAYSASSLRSMRVVIGLTLGWAEANRWIDRNPCVKIRLPKETGGRRVQRTVLTPEQVAGIAQRLEEPYATLVLLLYITGLRISEVVGLQWKDLQNGTLKVTRRVYEGEVGEVKSLRAVRDLPLHTAMVERLESLRSQFANREWIFQSRAGTPVDPRNALNRYVRPAVAELGIKVGGWHDFRHTLSTTLRRKGVHPKVVADILGHSKVDLAMNVYDRTDLQDRSEPLTVVGTELLASVSKAATA